MELLTKNTTFEQALQLSKDYASAYAKMSAGTRETYIIMCDDIDFNISIINNALSIGYWTGENYQILWETKCNFVTSKNKLLENTLQFLGIR